MPDSVPDMTSIARAAPKAVYIIRCVQEIIQPPACEFVERHLELLKCRTSNLETTAVIPEKILSLGNSFCGWTDSLRDRIFYIKVEPRVSGVAEALDQNIVFGVVC